MKRNCIIIDHLMYHHYYIMQSVRFGTNIAERKPRKFDIKYIFKRTYNYKIRPKLYEE